jgi:hypothetical protein
MKSIKRVEILEFQDQELKIFLKIKRTDKETYFSFVEDYESDDVTSFIFSSTQDRIDKWLRLLELQKTALEEGRKLIEEESLPL